MRPPVSAYSTIDLLNDAGLPDFMRGGVSSSGAVVNRKTILKNASVARCVFLISNAIGMLPFPLMKKGANGARDKAQDHPVYGLLNDRPND